MKENLWRIHQFLGKAGSDLNAIFEQFGYTPTDAEVNSLAGAFGAENNAASKAAGVSAVAQYVNYMDQVNEFNANDPLTGLQTRMNNMITQNQQSVQNLSNQLQKTLASAPQLFGSLTPDQITTYLAPLKTSFDTQLSQVQATLASRGLGASSTEANALAQTNEQFQQTVLNTGLNIGLTSQQNQAQALQQEINNLFGQTGEAIESTTSAAEQQSKQNLGESNLIGSLPSFLNSQALATAANNTAASNTGGFQNTFNQVTGDIGKGAGAAGNLLAAYSTSGASSVFSGFGSGGTGSPGSTFAQNPNGASANPAPANLNAPGYNPYGTSPITGRPTYAQFE